MRRNTMDDISAAVDPDANRIQALVNGARKGIEKHFEDLQKIFARKVYQFVYRRVGNPHDAEDLCQDIWIKVFINLPRLRQPASFKGWLFQIAIQAVNEYLGQPYRRWFVRSDDYEEMALRIEDVALKPDAIAMGNELSHDLWEAYDQLPKAQQAVFILKEYDGWSYAEIAAFLDNPVSTIRSNHRHAKQALRQNSALRKHREE